jgi:Zn-dependent peptidase ImmA (M78 family)
LPAILSMSRAESLARRARIGAGVADDVNVDITALARRHGADVVVEALGSDVAGMLVREQNRVVIGVNGSDPETRQRFTVAHEIGHLLMHRGRPLLVDAVRINLRDSRSSMATDGEEIEANSFAAELLMPRDLVLLQFRQAANAGTRSYERLAEDLAEGFGVSRQAMEYRLANLGLLRPA